VRKAVIDVGSNSVLLTVEERRPDGWVPLLETSDVTALGEGTKETGLLSAGAIDRTLHAIRDAHNRAREVQCDEIVAAATMAARIAVNAAEFLERAKSQGTPVTILSGEDEAELGFRAVASDPTFERHERMSIIDVGGHSTELVTAQRSGSTWNVLFRRSYPIGTLGLRGTVLADETLDMRALLRAVCVVDDAVGLAYLPGKSGHPVVLGATGTNLVSVRERMAEWKPDRVHGAWLDYEEVSKAVGWLGMMTDAERRAVQGMEPGREQTIHIGALILERFLHALRVLGCSVSVRGWRHALLENGLPRAHTL
jgi:exopolyphosphatase / guanosine-5'-triphosphate,3'-diphosphate pyrophosphatase